MLTLRVVQAAYGDCLILVFGTQAQPHYILIDGGPPDTYDRHLRAELQKITAAHGKLDMAVLSHVDNDHIIGLLDLLSELRAQQAGNKPRTVGIDALWHNAFTQTIDRDNSITPRLKVAMQSAGANVAAMTRASTEILGISEGNTLRQNALALQIPINPGFAGGSIVADDHPGPLQHDGLTLRIIGPTRQNLEALRKEWLAWLDDHADAIGSGDPQAAAMADQSVPNLSSIALLAEVEGKTILLTGDARGDHLIQGLKQAGLLDAKGKIHVNVLKLPHHGSDRNVDRQFFKTVTADQYVVSADGRYGNPDLSTCIWLVEAARLQKRKVEIIMTNETATSAKLVEEYAPKTYGYTLTMMDKGKDAYSVEVVPAGP